MGSFAFDIRDAVRGLRRDRGYAATVILTLALTIGATTAVFSIVNGVLLKPLAYRESDRLVALREIWRQLSDRIPVLEVNERHFEYWRTHAHSFESLVQYIAYPATLTGSGDAVQILVMRSSGSLFDVLQVQAAVGRTLSSDDEPSERPEVAVISAGLWRRRFGADPAVLGRTLVLDGKPRTIVGVLPAGFRIPSRRTSMDVDAFVPIHMDAERIGWEGDHNNEAIARLRGGVTPEQARAELDVLQAQVSDIATKEAHEAVTLASVVTPLTETIVGRSRRGLLLLLGAIGAVLLIACSNLTNLSLTRTVGRMRDAAVRSALGASRARLVARAVVEQTALALIGGALGLAIARAALFLFVQTAPIDIPRVSEVAIDARVLAFALVVSAMAGVIVSIVPAWHMAHQDVEQTLRAGALSIAGNRAGRRTRAALLALQVALSLALLTATGLLAESFVRVMNVERGFSTERVLVVPFSLPANRYDAERTRVDALDRLLAATRALPGVVSASTISMPPLAGEGQVNTVAADGATGARSEQPTANFRFVAPDFFRTLGIAILRGRAFADRDRTWADRTPALVSEPTARQLWPGEDALGKRFSRGLPGEPGFEVVGVVADAKLTSLERTPPLMVYVPYWWRARAATSLLIKTPVDRAMVLASVRRAVAAVDPDIAVGDARALTEIVDASIAGRRYQTQLFVAFGVVALFIAAVGVYGVTSYGASRRRREMNIRTALGARRAQIVALIARQAIASIAAGIVVGLVGAVALGGVMASLLFEVRARDPLVVAGVSALVATVGVAASMLAARRAVAIDPAAALREE